MYYYDGIVQNAMRSSRYSCGLRASSDLVSVQRRAHDAVIRCFALRVSIVPAVAMSCCTLTR